jgi:hypothetical protein
MLAAAMAAVAKDKKGYRVRILVSNEEEDAPVVDPLLKNAWGIAAGPQTPWWVADNGTGMSTIYTGAGEKRPLEVTVTGAAGPAPATGLVFNGGSGFEVGEDQPALFIFAAEDGTISVGIRTSCRPPRSSSTTKATRERSTRASRSTATRSTRPILAAVP